MTDHPFPNADSCHALKYGKHFLLFFLTIAKFLGPVIITNTVFWNPFNFGVVAVWFLTVLAN